MNLEHLSTPALCLDLDAFERNQRKAMEVAQRCGAALRPHYKSNRCTAIAHMQIDMGAKGITCAKVGEAEDLARAGIDDILIANQITALEKIDRVAFLARGCRLTVCVDDAENISALSSAAVRYGSTIFCLVEVDVGARRCGVTAKEDVLALAQRVKDSPNLVFDGLQAYAGQLSHQKDFEVRRTSAQQIESDLRELIAWLRQNGVETKEVSGVSTGSLQFREPGTVYTELQCGSYIFMDAAYGNLGLTFESSLTVLAHVMRITDEWVILDAGRKSVSVDQEMPRVFGAKCSELRCAEEHTRIPVKDFPNAKVGDLFQLIPGHYCTTMNLHDYLYLHRGGKIVDCVEITSRGRSY